MKKEIMKNRIKKIFKRRVFLFSCLFIMMSSVLLTGCMEKEVPHTDVYQGIDISFWQGDIDWDLLAENDISFIMVRISYGLTKDERFDEYCEEATKRNIKIGGYVYSLAETVEESRLEAETALSIISPYQFDYPICFDYETETFNDVSRRELNTEIALSFVNTIKEAGYNTAIYGSYMALRDCYNYKKLNKVDKWAARYLDMEEKNYSDLDKEKMKEMTFDIPGITMWQYSNMGKISGINEYVDLDISYIDYGNE